MEDAGDVLDYDRKNDEEQKKFPLLKNVSEVSNYCKALSTKVYSESEKG